MKITIENYTEHCLKTWGGDNQKERAKLGIIGELGEVAEVLKKHLRGDFDEIERDNRLLMELGDVCYYVAIHINLKGDCFIKSYNRYNDESQLTAPLFIHVREIINRISNSELVVLGLKDLINDLGFNIEQVMQANIEKLSCRAKRNVISGDGDDR